MLAILSISTQDLDMAPIRRTLKSRLFRQAHQILEWSRHRLLGEYQFNYYNYIDHEADNRGDIAIRLACEEILRRNVSPDVDFLEFSWDAFDDAATRRINRDCTALVIAGGGYLFLDRQGQPSPRLARHLALFRQLTCPVIGLGIGVNQLLDPGSPPGTPRLSPEGRAQLTEFRSRLNLLSVRDAEAGALLGQLAPDRPVTVLADPALFLSPTPIANPPRKERSDELRVGLNLNLHGPHSATLLPRTFPAVATAMQTLQRTRPCRFFYFVHADPERLLPRLFASKGIAVETVNAPPAEMVSWYGLLDVHLCGMLHSAILACNAGTPVFNLSYDVKHAGFFNMIGMAELSQPACAATPGNVLERFEALIAGRDRYREQILRRKAALAEEMNRFVAQMGQMP